MAHIPIETQTQYNDHAVGLLKTVNRSYYGSDSGFVNVVPKQVTTIWPTTPPTISQVCTVYDNNSDTDCMHPDAPNGPTFPGTGGLPMVYGSLLYQYEYGYGSGSRGGLLRKTVNDYAWLDTPTYLNTNLLNLPSSVNVYDGSSTQWRETTYSYDESGSASSGCSSSSPCGELTTVSGYTNSSTHLDTHYHYNTNGMRSSMVDPKGNVTCYTYDSHGAYLSEIQHPHLATPTMCSGFAEYFSYDYDTGLLSSHTDLNGNITASSYDPMWRPTETDNPDGGFTKYCYTDLGGSFCSASSPPYDALAEDKIDASTFRTTALQVDGLGRVTRRATTNGEAEAFDEVDTCYNDLGLIGFESYPYLGPGWSSGPICSGAGDQFTYDALSRNTLITHSDSSTMSTSYSISANLYCSTVTDEQSKSRQTCADAAGRLSTVTEDPSGLNYNTTYAYDAHDNLTSVTQNSSRNRTFSYDWLSRLQQATNPESATTCYGTYSGTTCQNNGYDGDGNLVYKTDARGITTTYSYDAMNRLTQKTYSDATPTAYYLYDQTSWDGSTLTNPTGRLTSEGTWTSGSGWLTSSAYGYNKMGKVAAQYECATSSCPAWPTWRLFYNYNLISGVTSYTNGAGTTFTQTFNVGGRISSVTSSWSDSQHPASLATGIHYNAVGGLEIETLGNGLTNTVAYHVRLQPCRNNVNSTGTLLVYCTDPIPSGNVLDLTVGYNYGSGDNGNVMTWSAVGAQTFTRNFAPSGYPYDGVNRLTGMTDTATGATCTGLSWSYDAWGNRQQNIVSGSSCNHWNALYNSNNQISTVGSTTYTYDAAGNLTYDGSNNYTYDTENHLVAISGGTNAAYLYDAEGRRVSKTVGGVTTGYVYDAMGHILTDVNGATLLTAYVPLNGQLLALYAGGTGTGGTGGTIEFAHQDHLGSTRLLTNLSQCVVDDLDYFPFGKLNPYSPPCPWEDTTHKFTGKERDSESNLDNFTARYYSSAQGRFMSPDPTGGHLENPQSLNKYAYALNNPVSLTDPTGLDSYLQCSPALDVDGNSVPSGTCQQKAVGYDSNGNVQQAWVQGVTQNGQFTATLIGNQNADGTGPLVDRTTGTGTYTASVNGSGVQFSNNGGQTSSAGVFLNGTPQTTFQDAGFAHGGALSGFSFTLTNSKLEANQTEAGFFTFNGTPDQAGAALTKAGFARPLFGENAGMNEYRSPGSFWTGANSGHFNVYQIDLEPWLSVPQAQGNMHFGEHSISNPIGLALHCVADRAGICQ